MRTARLLALCALALAVTGSVQARTTAGTAAPQGLKAFLLRADEPVKHEFNRTPAFAWLPVRGAFRYEFELATSRTFTESAIVWSNTDDDLAVAAPTTGSAGTATPPADSAAAQAKTLYSNLRSPAIALDIALPWITGSPYALYAHVRAITKDGVTAWSEPFGFNVRWSSIPRDLDSPHPGLVRWSPVEGATAYEVWLYGARKTFMTTTNVADARDLYTFHRGDASFTSSISFRVRAQRAIYGEVVSGLPATTWGPWSPTYNDPQPPLSLGELSGLATVSDVQSDSSSDRAHSLTPGFAFTGDRGGVNDYARGEQMELYRVYVATDRDCVNIVFRGAVVGSPAYAPRTTGPLHLPTDSVTLARARTSARGLDSGGSGMTLMVDGTESLSNEAPSAAPAASPAAAAPTPAAGSGSATTIVAAAKIDLPDTAWPSGGYYWTVVPVAVVAKPSDLPLAAGATFPIEYRETELPQDVCQSGRVMRFGKATPPIVTSTTRPFASGLSPTGRLVAAARQTPRFYGTPLVAWEAVFGAQEYEIQWSKTANPWRPLGSMMTAATSSLLPLEPGTWYYRVRGYNPTLLKRPQMAWSAPTALSVSKPTFAVVKKSGR
jgi:hypothetical protein